MTNNKKEELNNFLEDLRVGDIIWELENLKSVRTDEELTETEKAGAVLIALAESFEKENLIKALRNDDMKFLDEILTNQLMEAEESENEAIRTRFKACNDGELVEKTIELIHFLGSNIVRETLELIDDEDLEEMEKEEMEKVNKFLNKLEELKKEPLTRNENSGIALLIIIFTKDLANLFKALEENNVELLNKLLKDELEKIKDKEECKDRYKASETVIKETIELVDKLGKDKIKQFMLDMLEDVYFIEDKLFKKNKI